jgi:hypothetical protein
MDEARKRGGVFHGAVGRVQEGGSVTCGHELEDAVDVERLHFAADDKSEVRVTLSTTSLSNSAVPGAPSDTAPAAEKLRTSHTSPTSQIHSIKPLPPKNDYTSTHADPIFFLLCCIPI